MAIDQKSRRGFHPAVSILSWLVFALAVELAAPSHLFWLSFPAVLLVSSRQTLERFAVLVWKARWLWVALLLLYAWTVPGILLFPSAYSPTEEGLSAGVLRVGRLLLLLAALARLLSEFKPQELAGGIYILARPFESFGVDARALAVRLALTLEQVERLPKLGNWLALLKPQTLQAKGADELLLVIPAAGMKDNFVLIAAIAMLGLVLA